MDSVILMMVAVSLLLAAAAVSALLWGLRGGQFGEQAAFLRLNDSEAELASAAELEARQRRFAARGLLLLDRDGVINFDSGYLHDARKLRYIPGIFSLARAASQAGYLIAVCTNQSGIARGYYTQEQMHALHERMAADFAARGAVIEEFFFCPHAPDAGCTCRKPAPGMLLAAMQKFGKAANESIFIGDKPSDLQAAAAAGIARAYCVQPGREKATFRKVKDENFSNR